MNQEHITHEIIGCTMRVHSALGNGFQELIYQHAMKIEFADNNIIFCREYEMPVFYKEQQIGTRRVDFLIDGLRSVEL
jgi:GxxExxY protein